MNYFEIIAIFCAPIIGVSILLKKESINYKELFLVYPRYLFLANLITTLIIFILKEYNSFEFTVSFFIKYGFVNFFISILLALLEIVFKKNIRIEVNEKNKKK